MAQSTNNPITRRRFIQSTAAAAGAIAAGIPGAGHGAEVSGPPKTRSYNPNMEYRQLGKTGIMVSAVALGGHWKKLPHAFGTEEFKKNRSDVIGACIDHGINYVDACSSKEVLAYTEALRGRRDKMYLGYSFYEHEMRNKDYQTSEKLLEGFDDLMSRARLEYVDLWRITCYWKPATDHTAAHEEAIVTALEKARQAGKVRFTGISTHKHDWGIHMMNTYPEHIQVIVVPYTAGSKKAHARVDVAPDKKSWEAVPDGMADYDESMVSVIEAVKKHNVGWLGIKPFASGSLFKSRGAINPKTKDVDDQRARMTIRYVLCNEALTAPIPGLISVDQVKNVALAVTERRKFDTAEERAFEEAVDEMWANLPKNYLWLRQQWQWV